jgi:hypothetical protein
MIKRKARRTQTSQARQPITQKGFGHEMPPELALVQIYFEQQGSLGEAGNFFSFYRDSSWCGPKGKPYRNWKVLASAWIKKRTN